MWAPKLKHDPLIFSFLRHPKTEAFTSASQNSENKPYFLGHFHMLRQLVPFFHPPHGMASDSDGSRLDRSDLHHLLDGLCDSLPLGLEASRRVARGTRPKTWSWRPSGVGRSFVF